MYRNVKITEGQRRGRKGEHAIETRLTSFSNIYHPAFDVGIDCICDLIEEGSPTGEYFCVQTKSTKTFDGYWSRNIRKETIQLWLNQKYPVFLIVYDESSRNCYWESIERLRKFLNGKLKSDAETVSIRVDKSNVLEENSDNSAFVRSVKHDTILVNAQQGIPERIGGYVGFIPALYLSDVARERIKDRVRLGMNYLISDRFLKNCIEEAYELSQILAQFDRIHYDHFLVLARLCRRLGKFAEAEKNYDTAIEICKKDTNWNKRRNPDDPSIEDITAMVESEKAEFKKNPQL